MKSIITHKNMPILAALVLLSGWSFTFFTAPFNSHEIMASVQSMQNTDNTDNGDQLVMILKAESGITFSSGSFISTTGASADSLNNLLSGYQAKVVPMLVKKENGKDNRASSTLANTYFIYLEEKELLEEAADKLRKLDVVDAAYIKPPSEEPDL